MVEFQKLFHMKTYLQRGIRNQFQKLLMKLEGECLLWVKRYKRHSLVEGSLWVHLAGRGLS